MEDQEDGFVLFCANGILDVFLVLGEEFGVELDVTRLVDAMDVTESGSNGEVRGNWREGLIDGKNILWLSVEGVVVHILVVDTIFLTTCNTDLL